jgi:hypothetical protein
MDARVKPAHDEAKTIAALMPAGTLRRHDVRFRQCLSRQSRINPLRITLD